MAALCRQPSSIMIAQPVMFGSNRELQVAGVSIGSVTTWICKAVRCWLGVGGQERTRARRRRAVEAGPPEAWMHSRKQNEG